jgi:hypothetical protein
MTTRPDDPTMTTRLNALVRHLESQGWKIKDQIGSNTTLYRWSDTKFIREELVLITDTAGRLTAWSTWRNERTHIDGDTGLFDRLEALMGVQP